MASSPLFIKFKDTYSLLSYATEVIGIHEGFRSKRYKDTKGIWTIGYGFNLESGTFSRENVVKWSKFGISIEEANSVLREHIKVVLEKLLRMPWYAQLSKARQLAILDMSFNMGIGWINRWSNTIGFIKAGNYNSAGKAIRASAYAKQVGARALRNAIALEQDRYPIATATARELVLISNDPHYNK